MAKKSSDAIYAELGDAAKIIPRRVITRYAKTCALHNRLEKLRRMMRNEMLKAIREGVVPAVDGPFVLAEEKQSRIDADLWSWQMYALELAIQLDNGNVALAMRRCNQAELSAPRKDVPVLRAKANPSWGSTKNSWIEVGLNDESSDSHL